MTYWTNLFQPSDLRGFSAYERTISGFREPQTSMAEKVQPGDTFICYMTKTSRWIGTFEIVEGPFVDRDPLFVPGGDDPFVVRFRIEPRIWLDRDHTVPIQHPPIWDHLSHTQDAKPGGAGWIGPLRQSLQRIQDEDAEVFLSVLEQRALSPSAFPIEDEDWRKFLPKTVSRGDQRVVEVTVPQETDEPEVDDAPTPTRESALVQAKLAEIGEEMGFRVWIPKADRGPVLRHWEASEGSLLSSLPLNYDETTIENIDVL